MNWMVEKCKRNLNWYSRVVLAEGQGFPEDGEVSELQLQLDCIIVAAGRTSKPEFHSEMGV